MHIYLVFGAILTFFLVLIVSIMTCILCSFVSNNKKDWGLIPVHTSIIVTLLWGVIGVLISLIDEDGSEIAIVIIFGLPFVIVGITLISVIASVAQYLYKSR